MITLNLFKINLWETQENILIALMLSGINMFMDSSHKCHRGKYYRY